MSKNFLAIKAKKGVLLKLELKPRADILLALDKLLGSSKIKSTDIEGAEVFSQDPYFSATTLRIARTVSRILIFLKRLSLS